MQTVSSKSKRKGGRHEDQDEREGWHPRPVKKANSKRDKKAASERRLSQLQTGSRNRFASSILRSDLSGKMLRAWNPGRGDGQDVAMSLSAVSRDRD